MRVIAVKGSSHRHPRTGTGRHRRGFALIPQFVKHDDVGSQASHRAADALRLGAPQQHVASRKMPSTTEFSPLVHHRHPIASSRQPCRQITQQGGLARRGRTHHQQISGVTRRQHPLPQGGGTPHNAAGQTQTQRGHVPHRADASTLGYRRPRHTHTDSAGDGEIALLQFPLVGVHRLVTQT